MVASAAEDWVNWYAHDARHGHRRDPGTGDERAGRRTGRSHDAIIGPDGNVYVSGWTSGNVVRYNPTTGAFIDEFADLTALAPARSAALGMAFGPDGNLYVAAPSDSEVLRYNGTTGAFIDAFVTAGSGGLDRAGWPDLRAGRSSLRQRLHGHAGLPVRREHGRVHRHVRHRPTSGIPKTWSLDRTATRTGSWICTSPTTATATSCDSRGPWDDSPGAYIDEFVAARRGYANPRGSHSVPTATSTWGAGGTDEVDRYNGTTGAYIDDYVTAGLGGLDTAAYFNFIPGHQVMVIAHQFGFSKPITIDRSKISDGSCGATLTDFPMLFSSTDPDLRHTTQRGRRHRSSGATTSSSVARTRRPVAAAPPCTLDHEIEKYVNTTGELVAWVRIPSLNTSAAASDTVIYIHYGNSTVTSPTENPAGVWVATTSACGTWRSR